MPSGWLTSVWERKTLKTMIRLALTRALAVLFDAILLGAYAALMAVPAMAIEDVEITRELVQWIFIFAGAPQALRHIIRERGLRLDGS